MVKFIQVAFKKDMVKVNDGGKDVWFYCDTKAKGYAKTAFKEGDEVELVKERRNVEGTDVDFVTQVRKPGGQAPTAAPVATQSTPAPVSSPAAAPVAPVVQQSAPAPLAAPVNKGWQGKSPEESEKITRLSIMSSAANLMQVMTGQFTDPVQVTEACLAAYRQMLAEIKK